MEKSRTGHGLQHRRPWLGAAVVAGLGALVFLLPYTPGRSWPVLTQIAAVDPAIVTVCVVGGVAFAVGGVAGRRHGRGAPLGLIGLAFVLVVGLFAARVFVQGIGAGQAPRAEDTLRILEWNAGNAPPDEQVDTVFSLTREIDANVIVLPETGWKSADVLRDQLAEMGLDLVVFEWEGTATSVFMDPSLAKAGGYRAAIDETLPWAGLIVRPASTAPEFPLIVATHLQQPSPPDVSTWRTHLDWVEGFCDAEPWVIVVGDMNATLNQLGSGGLGACRDVGEEVGAGASATWPTFLPSAAGVALDRFLVGPGYELSLQALEVRRDTPDSVSDHWAIVAGLDAG